MPVHPHKAFRAQHPGRETLGNVVAGIDVDLIVIRVCKSGAIGIVPLHQRLQSLAVAAGSRLIQVDHKVHPGDDRLVHLLTARIIIVGSYDNRGIRVAVNDLSVWQEHAVTAVQQGI